MGSMKKDAKPTRQSPKLENLPVPDRKAAAVKGGVRGPRISLNHNQTVRVR